MLCRILLVRTFLANSVIFSFIESVSFHLFLSSLFEIYLLELIDTITLLMLFDKSISSTLPYPKSTAYTFASKHQCNQRDISVLLSTANALVNTKE